MKTLKYITFLLIFVSFFLTCSEIWKNEEIHEITGTRAAEFWESPYFYYYKGTKRYFELDTKHIFVSMEDQNNMDELITGDFRSEPLQVDIPEGWQSRTQYKRFWTVLSLGERLSEDEYLKRLAEIKHSSKNLIVAPFFKNRHKDKIGLSNFLSVQLYSLNDIELLLQEAEKENAVIVYQNEFMPLWFVVSVTEKSRYDAMELANHFYESGLFQCAEPDLMNIEKTCCVNDLLFKYQWSLSNMYQIGGNTVDIKACSAWGISTGKNVIIATIDEGIHFDPPHADLADNILYHLSFDLESMTSPQEYYGKHGTEVIGISNAVSGNSWGIAGVAPDSKIMSISVTTKILSRVKRAYGINWAWKNGADVINNSWSFDQHFIEIDVAIDSAVTYGRGGKGCVVVFASGNDGANSVGYPASLNAVMAVGAINSSGIRATSSPGGSNFGDALDIVAPGENVYVTSASGAHIPENGTSYAAPHVSGVAALIISRNPDLTGKQVRDIIESTAWKLPTYTFNVNKPNGTWNEEVGYGLVDAYAALLAVPPPSCVKNISNLTVTTNTTVSGCDITTTDVTVSNGANLTLQAQKITINAPFTVQAGSTFTLTL